MLEILDMNSIESDIILRVNFESDMRHIEEIKAAGYDLPSVNKIECTLSVEHSTDPVDESFLAASFLPTKRYCQMLRGGLHRRASIFPQYRRKGGAAHHLGGRWPPRYGQLPVSYPPMMDLCEKRDPTQVLCRWSL